ncbi:MAG: DUF418 domain-containing protein [Pseudomonadota bacterium]
MTASFETSTPSERTAAPTVGAGRLQSLDVLRGFAVLMIFVVNIKMMANGYNHYADRSLWQGEYDQLIGYLHNLLVHGKFVTIFTALFGAGLALLLAREKPVALAVVLRRLAWLAAFGAIHLIFIREGDILVQYALVGFLAILFVKMTATALLTIAVFLQLTLFVAGVVFPVHYDAIPILWQDGPDMHLEVQRIMLGTSSDQVSARLDAVRFYMLDLFVFGRDWLDKLSVMLLKTGFLTGELAARTYGELTIITALVCATFLLAAPLWLARFRFGPLEWLWRSLTYGERQKMIRS